MGEGIKTKLQVHADRMVGYHDVLEKGAADMQERAQRKENDRLRQIMPAWIREVARRVKIKQEGEKQQAHPAEESIKPQMEPEVATEKAPKAKKNTEPQYEVEKILDDSGSRKAGDKKFLIRWKGYDKDWDTWEPIENLIKCSKAVEKYELAKAGMYYIAGSNAETKEPIVAYVKAGVLRAAMPEGITIKMDINDGKSAEETLNEICRRAGIRKEDIAVAWASPPCNTYSRANHSNISRGWMYRHKDGTPVEGWRGEIARQHDQLTQKVKQILLKLKMFVMENPASGMEKMEFMQDWETRKNIVDLCAFGWPFKKTTNLWIEGIDWTPVGNTGDGRCGGKCGQGEINKVTNLFNHYMALAVEPNRGPRGEGAVKLKCGMPRALLAEILMKIAEKQDITDKVVLDICAGFQSMREVAHKLGLKYVAVDIQGDRMKKLRESHRWQHRKQAILVKRGRKVLTVQDAIPSSTRGPADESDHAAAMTQLQVTTGIDTERLKTLARGPCVIATRDTTYYAYELREDCEFKVPQTVKWTDLWDKDATWKSSQDKVAAIQAHSRMRVGRRMKTR